MLSETGNRSPSANSSLPERGPPTSGQWAGQFVDALAAGRAEIGTNALSAVALAVILSARHEQPAGGGGVAQAQVSMKVNGEQVTREVPTRTLLVEFLRYDLGLTGTHVGCDTSQCGACNVHVDGQCVKACTMLAVQATARTC